MGMDTGSGMSNGAVIEAATRTPRHNRMGMGGGRAGQMRAEEDMELLRMNRQFNRTVKPAGIGVLNSPLGSERQSFDR
jgi:hypothetical protein